MVKGVSRQVIVVHSPDQKLFDQAIFILSDDAVSKEGITDEMLLKSADKLLSSFGGGKRRGMSMNGPVWGFAGALVTGLVWLVSNLL